MMRKYCRIFTVPFSFCIPRYERLLLQISSKWVQIIMSNSASHVVTCLLFVLFFSFWHILGIEVHILRQACTKRIYIHITGEASNAGRKRSIYDKKFAVRAPPKIIANQLSKGRATIRLQNSNTPLTSRASMDAPVIILAKCPVQKLKNFMQVLRKKLGIELHFALVLIKVVLFFNFILETRVRRIKFTE